ncbi:MAG TPA: SIMPL domain-containing protein [Candidatus Dormibacteraeota bacterium]|nr:SIMPL domain-containing protein [Candidatus Dormibacteraeota bacterium]
MTRSATLFALLALASPALADDVPPPRTIAVSGEGKVSVSPDLAVVSFGVETTAPTAGAAVADNAKKSTALVDAIKQTIDAKDKVATTQYSLSPVYEQRDRASAAPPKIIGYIASNLVRVELHDVKGVGALIDAATSAGANRANDLQFTLEERAEAQSNALARAGADAKRQAEATAAALGVELGRVLSATTSGGPIVYPRTYARAGMVAMAEAAPPPPIEASDVDVSVTLQVTYEIK